MDFTFAMRQVTNARDLYEYAQKMQAWLPSLADHLCTRTGLTFFKEPRYIVLHDADSAGLFRGAGAFPAWTEVDSGLIHLCPDPAEWKRQWLVWVKSLPADSSEMSRIERYARIWSQRMVASVVLGQSLARFFQPVDALSAFPDLLWLAHGLALHLGRCAWESAEPVLQEEAAAAERTLLESSATVCGLNAGFGPMSPPSLQWAARLRAGAAAHDLVERVGLRRLLESIEPATAGAGAGEKVLQRMFIAIGFSEHDAIEFMRKWNEMPPAA